MGKIRRRTISATDSINLDGLTLRQASFRLLKYIDDFGEDASLYIGECDSWECGGGAELMVSYARPETDVEYNKRQREHDKKLERDAILKEKQEARERKELERLKRKYETE